MDDISAIEYGMAAQEFCEKVWGRTFRVESASSSEDFAYAVEEYVDRLSDKLQKECRHLGKFELGYDPTSKSKLSLRIREQGNLSWYLVDVFNSL